MSRELSAQREARRRPDEPGDDRKRRPIGDDPSGDDRKRRPIGDDPSGERRLRNRPLGDDPSGDRERRARPRPIGDDPSGDERRRARRPAPDHTVPHAPSPAAPSLLDAVAGEVEELLRDLRQGWRVWQPSDKVTFLSALLTLVGTLLPWISDRAHPFQIGLVSGGVLHAALACAAVALLVGRARRVLDSSVGRSSQREQLQASRRTSLWHLLIGAASTVLCAYLLVVYGLQRTVESQLQIRFGLYVTLAAGMGLSYGGFSRFWSSHA